MKRSSRRDCLLSRQPLEMHPRPSMKRSKDKTCMKSVHTSISEHLLADSNWAWRFKYSTSPCNIAQETGQPGCTNPFPLMQNCVASYGPVTAVQCLIMLSIVLSNQLPFSHLHQVIAFASKAELGREHCYFHLGSVGSFLSLIQFCIHTYHHIAVPHVGKNLEILGREVSTETFARRFKLLCSVGESSHQVTLSRIPSRVSLLKHEARRRHTHSCMRQGMRETRMREAS